MIGPPLPFLQRGEERRRHGRRAFLDLEALRRAAGRRSSRRSGTRARRSRGSPRSRLWVCDSQGSLRFTQSSAVFFAGVSAALRGDIVFLPSVFGSVAAFPMWRQGATIESTISRSAASTTRSLAHVDQSQCAVRLARTCRDRVPRRWNRNFFRENSGHADAANLPVKLRSHRCNRQITDKTQQDRELFSRTQSTGKV